MSSSDEDDYMSDTFLTKAIQEDVRPGLARSHQKSHQYEMEAKKARVDAEQRQKQLPKKYLESQRRDEGMSAAISSDNKGFAMLAKMGYKQGDALGRSTTTGIVEPIAIQVKNDRGGLGRETAIKQLEDYKEKLRLARIEKRNAQNSAMTVDEFRLRMSQKTNEKLLQSDLCKCQRACEKLDLDGSIEVPAMKFFWPERIKNEINDPQEDPYSISDPSEDSRDKEKGSSDSDDSSSSDSHDECCGESHSSECSDHCAKIVEVKEAEVKASDQIEQQAGDAEANENNDGEQQDKEDEIEYEISEKLEMLTSYLQTTYCYCHWCGVHYKDAIDMQDNCPGPTKDDH